MVYYSAAAAVLVGLVSLLLVHTLKRLELRSYRVVAATAVGSAAVSLLFPLIFKTVSLASFPSGEDIPLLTALSISAAVSLVLIFIFSVAASLTISDSTFDKFLSMFGRRPATGDAESGGGQAAVAYGAAEPLGNYLEEIFSDARIGEYQKTADSGDNRTKAENNLEKSVDREENTDKMGIETLEQDFLLPDVPVDGEPEEEIPASGEEPVEAAWIPEKDSQGETEALTVEDCIESAFRLKESGDFESAILYFMDALDKKPGKDLIFWIVLDICVLYRELNQVGLARDILGAYMDQYGDLMSVAVRKEIENNLQYI